MNVFHLAAIFDSSLSLEVLMNNGNSKHDTDELLHSVSSEFHWGTPLHIAAAYLSVDSATVLLRVK